MDCDSPARAHEQAALKTRRCLSFAPSFLPPFLPFLPPSFHTWASNAMVALSVSMSQSASPGPISSPS